MSDHQSPFVPANYSSDSEKSSNSSDPVVEARKQEAIECLKQVLEPILNKDIVSLGVVRIFQIVDNYVYFRLYIGAHQQYLQERAQDGTLFSNVVQKDLHSGMHNSGSAHYSGSF